METLDMLLSNFKAYRKLRKGIWRYVVCKYPAPVNGCWIRNEGKYWFEFIEREEIYAESKSLI